MKKLVIDKFIEIFFETALEYKKTKTQMSTMLNAVFDYGFGIYYQLDNNIKCSAANVISDFLGYHPAILIRLKLLLRIQYKMEMINFQNEVLTQEKY